MNRKEAVYEKDTDTQSDFYSFFICDWLHYADSVTVDDFHIIKPENEVFQFPIKWIPEHSVGLANYKEVWGSAYNFGMYYLNSIKVTVISTVLQILVSALGAYGFTKIKWKGRDQLF